MTEVDLGLVLALFSARSLDALLGRLAEEIASMVAADHAAFFWRDLFSKAVEIRAVFRLPQEFVGDEVPENLGLVGRAIESMRPEGLLEGDHWEWDPFGDSLGPHRALAYPLRLDERSVGVLYLIWDKPYPLEEAVARIGEVESLLRLAIGNAVTAERVPDHESLLQAFATMYGMLSDLVNAPSLDEVYERIWDYWRNGVDHVSLWLLEPPLSEPEDGSSLVLKGTCGRGNVSELAGTLTLDATVADALREADRTRPFGPDSDVGALFRRVLPQDRWPALSIWPLISGPTPLGFLALAWEGNPEGGPDEYRALVHRYIVSQIAVTLHGHLIQDKLESTGRFLQSILDGAGDAIIVTDREDRVVIWNPAAERMYGYAAEETLSRPVVDFIRPESQRRLAVDAARRVRRTLEPFTVETTRQRKDGSEFYVRLTISPVVDRDGRYLGMTGISTDITEQVRLREKLRRQTDRLSAILDTVYDGVIMHDLERKVLVVNRRFEEMFGVRREDVIGKSLDYVAERVRSNGFLISDEMLRPFRYLSDHPELSDEGEMRLQHESMGTQMEIRWYSIPVVSRDGERLGRIYALGDVTKERQAERAKSRFISLVSHELRTPIATIRGFAELILHGGCGPINDEMRESLEMIMVGTDHLASMVDDMLTLAKREAGKLELEVGAVDVGGVIRRAVDSFRPLVNGKGQEVRVALGELPLVSADARRLLQVVTNLLSNACKYTPPGGRIEVGARFCADAGCLPPDAPREVVPPCVLVWVSDTGIGIREEERQYIFGYFFRGDDALAAREEGSGLGLAVVRSLIEAHGGCVWFDSVPGEGTTFYFTLPIYGGESASAS